MSEHNIYNFMKLAINGKGTSDRASDSDHYYRGVYEKIASGKKVSVNWCALLFVGAWMLYRKMYLYALLFIVFQCLYGESVMYIATHAMGVASYNALPTYTKFIVVPLGLAPHIFLGFIGNWLYIQQIHTKIDRGYHLGNVRNIDKFTWILVLAPQSLYGLIMGFSASSSKDISDFNIGYLQRLTTVFSVLLTSVLCFLAVKRDEKNLKMVLAEKEGASAVDE